MLALALLLSPPVPETAAPALVERKEAVRPVEARPELAAFAAKVAAEALTFAESEAARLPGKYTLRLLQPPVLPPLPKGEPRIDGMRLSKAEPTGRFFVTARLVHEGRPVGFVRVDCEGTWTGSLLRAREAMPRKAVPDPGQLETAAFEGTPPPGALVEFPEGMRLRQPVGAGKVITRADLEAIPLVLAGERMKLIASTAGLTIQVDGTARSSGGHGERVRVEVAGSRRLVQAVVTAQGEARLAGGAQDK